MATYFRQEKWWCDYYVAGKRERYPIDALTKREAEKRLRIDKRIKLAEAKARKYDIPYSEALIYFLKDYCGYTFKPDGSKTFTPRSVAEGTADRYWTSSKMLSPYFVGKTLKEITKLDIVNYIECRREGTSTTSPCKDPTIIRDLRMFSKMFEFIISQTNWDGNNVVKSFDKKYLKDSKTRVRSLTDFEKKQLLDSAKISGNFHMYHEIKFSYLTGLRWNEQFSLLRSDFERTNFGPQIGFVGKGGKYRIVPLCDEALEIVEILLRIPSVKSDYLFYHPDTGDRVNSNRSSWLKCLEKSEITDFRWHDLRHTYATDEIKKGMPIYTLSKMMGHANVVVTEKYAHLYTEDLHAAKRKVDTKADTNIGLSA